MKGYKDMICVFDPYNKLKNDTTFPQVVKLKRVVKRMPFGNTIWVAENVYQEGSNVIDIYVREKYLFPSSVICTRLSPDVPCINERDINTLKYFIKTSNDAKIKDLEALCDKLIYVKKMREV